MASKTRNFVLRRDGTVLHRETGVSLIMTANYLVWCYRVHSGVEIKEEDRVAFIVPGTIRAMTADEMNDRRLWEEPLGIRAADGDDTDIVLETLFLKKKK